jgi:hypothetical protein
LVARGEEAKKETEDGFGGSVKAVSPLAHLPDQDWSGGLLGREGMAVKDHSIPDIRGVQALSVGGQTATSLQFEQALEDEKGSIAPAPQGFLRGSAGQR